MHSTYTALTADACTAATRRAHRCWPKRAPGLPARTARECPAAQDPPGGAPGWPGRAPAQHALQLPSSPQALRHLAPVAPAPARGLVPMNETACTLCSAQACSRIQAPGQAWCSASLARAAAAQAPAGAAPACCKGTNACTESCTCKHKVSWGHCKLASSPQGPEKPKTVCSSSYNGGTAEAALAKRTIQLSSRSGPGIWALT